MTIVLTTAMIITGFFLGHKLEGELVRVKS